MLTTHRGPESTIRSHVGISLKWYDLQRTLCQIFLTETDKYASCFHACIYFCLHVYKTYCPALFPQVGRLAENWGSEADRRAWPVHGKGLPAPEWTLQVHPEEKLCRWPPAAATTPHRLAANRQYKTMVSRPREVLRYTLSFSFVIFEGKQTYTIKRQSRVPHDSGYSISEKYTAPKYFGKQDMTYPIKVYDGRPRPQRDRRGLGGGWESLWGKYCRPLCWAFISVYMLNSHPFEECRTPVK